MSRSDHPTRAPGRIVSLDGTILGLLAEGGSRPQPIAFVTKQTDTQVFVHCPYCGKKHAHGRLRKDAHKWVHRGGHCAGLYEHKGMRHEKRERYAKAWRLIERWGGDYCIPPPRWVREEP